jgi:hypothetical protein
MTRRPSAPYRPRFPRSWVALLALSLLAGCGGEDEPLLKLDPSPKVDLPPIAVSLVPGCNPLATSDACMFPFPSHAFTRADAMSPTGVRVNLDPQKLPLRDGKGALDAAPYNAADGFSPIAPILVHFGVNIDVSGLPDAHHLDQALKADSTVALFDLETGKRVLHFVEMDRNIVDGYDGRYAFILRPVEPMAMGHRHVVLIKSGLSDERGLAILPTEAFRALRDGGRSDSETLEALRPHYDEIFAFAEQHGYARSDLLLAWDFPVASEDYLLGSVLSMRKEALDLAGKGGLGFTITSIVDDPNADIARIVLGDFEVPTFLQADDSFAYDEQHHPIRQPVNRSYPFTMLIPSKAKDGAPLPLGLLGHGIFGQGRDFLTGKGDGEAIQKLSNQYGVVLIATDWIGLSKNDIVRIAAEVAPNLDRISIITDQLQQSLINNLTLTKLARGALKDDPKVKLSPAPLLDLSRTYYWGASLGGIQGSSFVSISDDIARAVFGVPGAAWATMIPRSIVFPPLRAFLSPHYPDPLDLMFGVSLTQSRFDHTDPANLTKLMFERPLPDAPAGRIVILQEAIGDSQVPNLSTEILARAMGVKQMTPAVEPVFGLEPLTSPANTSVLAQYRLKEYNMPLPPDNDTPPDSDNGVHHAMNFLPNVHSQIAKLWFEGAAAQVCDGPCDPD